MKERVLFIYDKEVKHYEGLEIKEGASCIVRLTNYSLQLCDVKKRILLNISLKDIINIGIISDKELVEKDKNVIARGVVGSVLFGGAGLVLGGLSGLQKKQVTQNIDYLVINYKSNSEDKVINVYAKEGVFDDNYMKQLNNLIDISKKELKCPNCGSEYNIRDIKCANCGKELINMKYAKVIKFLLGLFIVLFIALIVLMIVGGNINNKDVDIIKEKIMVNEEKAENIDNVLKEIGINEIDNIEADIWLNDYEGAGSKGYRIKTDFSDNVILYLDSNNNVICIRNADEDYYRNGKVLKVFE